jgi:hypothetical protein
LFLPVICMQETCHYSFCSNNILISLLLKIFNDTVQVNLYNVFLLFNVFSNEVKYSLNDTFFNEMINDLISSAWIFSFFPNSD